ncbi:hypothetical protein [Sorangium sp. So ce388]|uniref:Uncharacterized protein n=1 Tax=Sorangium cellulosum TaxID=56 RepID=A0A150RNZ5_SORCE|nr:hypothetical protein BE17_10860 [Sorangium cellulosum]
MMLVSSARAARSAAPRHARRRLVKPLLGLTVFAALFVALAWRLDRPSSAAGPLDAVAANPLGQLSRSAADRASVAGRVEERLPAGSYTYVAVRDGEALTWVVTLGDAPPPGTPVQVRSMGRRTDFHSRRLERTFPELVFGIVSRAD